MSDANYTSLAAQREPSWGVPPTVPGLRLLRFTGESIAHQKDTIVSEEIRSDRQISDLAEVGSSASGNLDFELSYLAWIEWFEAALFSDVVTINAAGITADADLALQTITASTGTPFAAVLPGCFVRVTGFTNPGNNGIKLVLAVNVDKDELTLAAGSLVADQAAGTITVSAKHLKNGTARHSYLIERGIENSDGEKYYQRYAGMMVDQMELNIESKQIVTGTLQFIGRRGEVADESIQTETGEFATGVLTLPGAPTNGQTVTIGARVYTYNTVLGGAYSVLIGANLAAARANLISAINGTAGMGTTYGNGTAAHDFVTAAPGTPPGEVDVTTKERGVSALATTATAGTWGAATLTGGVNVTPYLPQYTGPVLNGTSNVGSLRKDDLAMSEKFKTLSITIANNLRGKDAIGEKGNWDVGVGSLDVSGSASAYFRNNNMLADFINHDYTGLSMVLTDGDGKSIGINLPRINFGTGGASAEGKDTDLMQGMDYQAILSDTYGATILVSFLD